MASGQIVRTLVVTAQQGLRDDIGQALERWPGDIQVFWVSQPGLAVARAQELTPHLILLDDDGSGLGLLPAIRDLGTRVPNAAVLALVEKDDIDQARQAVLAGARGFLTKPLQAEELLASLRQALESRRSEPDGGGAEGKAPGRALVFCAPKGGTGRTALAVNTAVCLHKEARQPVALVDADYAAPAIDVAMNLHFDRSVADLLPRLSRLDEELVGGVLAPHKSGVRALLAPPPASLSHPISLPHVQSILVVLRQMCPWVVVDLGLPLDETAFGFLDGADRIVMTVLPEMVGLRNTRLMLDRLQQRGYPDSKVWLVLNRAGLRGGVDRKDIEELLHMSLASTVPDDQALVTHSVNRGVPLILSHRRSAVARAVRKLTRALIQDLAIPEPAPARAGRKARVRSTVLPADS